MTQPAGPLFNPTELCSLKDSLGCRQTLSGLLLDMLRQHFSQNSYIEQTQLRELIWQDTDRTDILLEMANNWKPSTLGKRPAVLVSPGKLARQKIAINNQAQGFGPGPDGEEYFSTIWEGSHTLYCVSSGSASTEYLAAEVQRHFTAYESEIRKWLALNSFMVQELGEISVLEEAQENFVVPVVLTYRIADSWTVAPQVPKITSINFRMFLK